MIEEKGEMKEGMLLLAAACLPVQVNDCNTAELCVSCRSHGSKMSCLHSQAKCWKGGHWEGEQNISVKFRF